MQGDHFGDFGRARAVGMEDRRGAEMQREIHAVAEAVGEIEFGDGEEAIVGAET